MATIPVGTNIDTKLKELTTWTPEAIAKDPLGFVTHATYAADDILLKLKAAQIGMAQQRRSTERKMAASEQDLAAVKALFAEFRTAYQEADSQQTWPKTVHGTAYSETQLRNQVWALGQRYEACLAENKRLPEFHDRLSSYAIELEQRLFDAQAARSEFARQREVLRMNTAMADLSKLEAQVRGLADTEGFLLANNGTPTVNQLVEGLKHTVTEAEFTELLTMPLE
jgi:hypothetical protein